jgi:uncharacterized integral membrane protein (TIGR00697 family)
MNELIFLAHILLVIGSVVIILQKSGCLGLSVFVVLQAILANLFVLKQMTLFGFDVTCSDVFAIGGILSLNLIQEFYGVESAKKIIWISFACMVFFTVMTQIHLSYIPSSSDQTQLAFTQIFSATPRIISASIAVFFVVQQIDVRVFSKLQTFFKGSKLPLRIALSLFLSQTIDTVLFSFLGLYGLVSTLLDIILVSLFVKFITILASTPFTAFLRRWRVCE